MTTEPLVYRGPIRQNGCINHAVSRSQGGIKLASSLLPHWGPQNGVDKMAS